MDTKHGDDGVDPSDITEEMVNAALAETEPLRRDMTAHCRAISKYAQKCRLLKKYRCEQCDLNCASSSELKRHLTRTKAHGGEAVRREKKHRCDYCKYETADLKTYHEHLQTARHTKKFREAEYVPVIPDMYQPDLVEGLMPDWERYVFSAPD